MLFLTHTGLILAQKAQAEIVQKDQTLVGRVLASRSDFARGAGVGPKWESFLFGMNPDDGQAGSLVPVKVEYAYFDSPLHDRFFDYSKLYEFRVHRESGCDEKVSSFSTVRNSTASGRPLPPSFVLRFLDGAPKVHLESDSVLPCFVLHAGDYRMINRP
jgi:hypothetical protein